MPTRENAHSCRAASWLPSCIDQIPSSGYLCIELLHSKDRQPLLIHIALLPERQAVPQEAEMFISDLSLNPITDPAQLKRLSGMDQFHGIPDAMLFKLAGRVTTLRIPSRWEAIQLIVEHGIPIPVVKRAP